MIKKHNASSSKKETKEMISFQNSCDGFYHDSLDVRFTNICDNNCPFCIERNGLSLQKLNIPKMIETTKQSKRKNILILGGEPLLQLKNVLAYINGIRNYVDNIYITTSLPKTISDDWSTFCEIMHKINGLNVSLQHYDYHMNNQIMHASSDHNRIKLLKQICNTDDFANICRVSINLVKGYIDNKSDIDKFLSTMEELDVKHVKINELQNNEDLYVAFEQAYHYKLPSPYAHGCQHDIDLPYELRITLKRSCFCVNQNLNASVADLEKAIIKKIKPVKQKHQMVLYESGELSDGWK